MQIVELIYLLCKKFYHYINLQKYSVGSDNNHLTYGFFSEGPKGTIKKVVLNQETPVKKIILDGITTISTDFYAMGVTAAELILSDSKKHVEVPFKLTLRASL